MYNAVNRNFSLFVPRWHNHPTRRNCKSNTVLYRTMSINKNLDLFSVSQTGHRFLLFRRSSNEMNVTMILPSSIWDPMPHVLLRERRNQWRRELSNLFPPPLHQEYHDNGWHVPWVHSHQLCPLRTGVFTPLPRFCHPCSIVTPQLYVNHAPVHGLFGYGKMQRWDSPSQYET